MKDISQKNSRWKLAQHYELNWWKKRQGLLHSEYYKYSADEIKSYLGKENILISEDTKILEIGSGMCGILTFLNESQNRYAIDPLESYYSSVPEFTSLRDELVKYSEAKGESLPFADNEFDLIILDNVLDHCESPSDVLSEIIRVLKRGGLIYFRQNTYNYYGKFMRSLMELIKIDKGHPFTFTKTDLRKLFEKNRLVKLSTDRVGYFPTWKNELMSSALKDKIKAFLFITRDKVTYLLRKT